MNEVALLANDVIRNDVTACAANDVMLHIIDVSLRAGRGRIYKFPPLCYNDPQKAIERAKILSESA